MHPASSFNTKSNDSSAVVTFGGLESSSKNMHQDGRLLENTANYAQKTVVFPQDMSIQ